jgi:hypothetical protein
VSRARAGSLPPGPSAPATVNTARLIERPLESLLGWRSRYGDVFTVKYLIFGTGVYVADPAAVRELLTGDQSDLHAGEANAPLSPVLGPNSVLVLDGPEHLRQRRLLLPPFQGSAVKAFRDVIRDVAEAEVARWAPGREIVLRERMRALTFEVICRAVFGVTEPVRVARLRAALAAVIDTGAMFFLPGPLRQDLGPWSPWGRLLRRVAAADRLIYEEIARRRSEPDLGERTDVLSLLLRARDEEGQAMTDPELRDELMTMLAAGHETTAPGVRLRPPTAPPAQADQTARGAGGGGRPLPGGNGHRVAATAAGDRRQRANAHEAARRRRMGAAGRNTRLPRDRPCPSPRGPVPQRASIPAGALPRRARRVLLVASLRRWDQALHRRGTRPG